MRKLVAVLICILTLPSFGFIRTAAAQYWAYTEGHMDVSVQVDNGQLRGIWLNDFAVVNGQINSTEIFLAEQIMAVAVYDSQTPPDPRPEGSEWDFLGVPAGAPIYILPSSGDPATVPYLGFSTEDISLSGFDSIRFTLTGMTAPAGGVFSLFISPASVFMNTLNGFPAGEVQLGYGNHTHYNWAFSKPGVYDLTFGFEAIKDGDVVMTGSDMFRFDIIPEPSAGPLLVLAALAWAALGRNRLIRGLKP